MEHNNTNTESQTKNEEVNKILSGWSGFKYGGKDNYGKLKTDYMVKVAELDSDKLFEETKSKIWLSAYANNNPRSDYHWHCDFCYDLLKLRREEKIYTKAHKQVSENI